MNTFSKKGLKSLGILFMVILFVFGVFLVSGATNIQASESPTFNWQTGTGFVPHTLLPLESKLNKGQIKKLNDVAFFTVEKQFIEVICESGPNAEAEIDYGTYILSDASYISGKLIGFNLNGFSATDSWSTDPFEPDFYCSGPGTFGETLRIESTLKAQVNTQLINLL